MSKPVLHLLSLATMALILAGCAGTKLETSVVKGSYELERYQGPKRKVAVTRFVNNTRFGKRRLGDNISDVLTTELNKSGRFLLLERTRIDEILDQVALAQSGITEGKINEFRMLDADYIVTGAVTHYAVNTSGSRGFLSQSKTQKAEVAADVRLIDVRSGQVILSESGKGDAERVYTKTLGIGASGGYDEAVEQSAFRAAVIRLTEKIVQRIDQHPWSCDVVEIDGSKLYLDAGRKSNLRPGDQVQIYRQEKEIRNRAGALIGFEENLVAEGKITGYIGEDGAVVQIGSRQSLELPLICRLSRRGK